MATNNINVAIEEAPGASKGSALVLRANTLIIRDRESHEAAREFLKGAKALKREIEAHYAAIKRPLNDARAVVLELEKKHLAPVDQAIAIAERIDTQYVQDQRRIEEAENRRREEEARAAEQKRRDAEAAEAERAALKLEAASGELSQRERNFIHAYLASDKSPRAILAAAKTAGYKDPEAQVARLLKSKKINDAIAGMQAAARVREQAEVKAAEPIHVDVAPVESQIGTVAGTSLRKYYAVGAFDVAKVLRKLADEYEKNPMLAAEIHKYLVDSTDDEERPAALRSLLNAQARQCKDLFEAVWPGCKLAKREGVVG